MRLPNEKVNMKSSSKSLYVRIFVIDPYKSGMAVPMTNLLACDVALLAAGGVVDSEPSAYCHNGSPVCGSTPAHLCRYHCATG